MVALTEVPDAELEAYRQAIVAEQDRRRTLATAENQATELNTAYLAAAGIKPGDPWQQPTSAVDAYPKGWEAPHAGKDWVSLFNGNVWEPGVSGWRAKTDDATVPEFAQPTGQLDAYQTGDHIMFDGTEYVSTIDNNVWSPADYPAGWEAA